MKHLSHYHYVLRHKVTEIFNTADEFCWFFIQSRNIMFNSCSNSMNKNIE